MKLYDAHTHLNTAPLIQHRRSYLKSFIETGGVGMVNSGASESYNIQGIEIAKVAEKEFPSCIVKTTLGLHPLECVDGTVVANDIPSKMQRLKQLYADNKHHIVAIGETGLDVYYPNGLETLETQKQLFIQHCELARETGLPLIVHSRDTFHETLEILKDYKDLIIYFHCRGYGPEEFIILSAEFKNLYIGFCGNITYKKADKLRETLKLIPLTQLLLETDAPYLPPQAIRGEINHPANVRYIYDFIHNYLKIAPEALSEQIEVNFRSIYKL